MFQTTTKKAKGKPAKADGYARHKERARRRQAAQTKKGQDVGPLPPVANMERKLACLGDLKLFNTTYFPGRYPLPFGPDQILFQEDLQRIIHEGGQQAESLPRGSGKTTFCETGAIYAIGYGLRCFLALIGATQGKAAELLENVKAEIESNPLLAEDFPELCHCVIALEGSTGKANGQHIGGKRTKIVWKADTIRFPTIAGSPASGAIIVSEGITGSIRGLSRLVNGLKVRPDLVILDDPQTDESARSQLQNITRESIVSGAVLGLAGPGKKIAVIMPCTPIRPNDMVDRMLNRDLHPDWHGRRCKLLATMPKRVDLWERYGEILRECLRQEEPDRTAANEFYFENRAEMDEGATPTWPARFNPDQASAIQYAMDIFILTPAAFAAEYQCEPIPDQDDAGGAEPIDPEQARKKLNRVKRSEIPYEATRLTCGIDIQHEILFYTVAGWDEKFGGHVMEYGTFPDQGQSRFSAAAPPRPLSSIFKNMSLEARIFAGLEQLAQQLVLREWVRSEGQGPPLRIERALADAGDGQVSDTIYQWARQSAAAAVVLPSKGMFIGAAKTPFSEWKLQQHEKGGPGWRLKPTPTGRGRLLQMDTNHWKSFIAERLRSPEGTHGAMFLYGSDMRAHATFVEHLAAEFPRRMKDEKTGRTVDEWQLNAGRPDNHWFDCLVMCCAGAAERGLRWKAADAAGVDTPAPKRKRRMNIEERYNAARAMDAEPPTGGLFQ